MFKENNTPERIDNLADADYRRFNAVSKSSLDQFAKSPAHYKHVILDGNRPAATSAMLLGSAFDTLLLTPGLFQETYAVAPEIRRGTKAWDEFVADNPGKQLIKVDEMQQIHAMAIAVKKHPEAAKLLTGGTAQVSFKWQDKQSGLLCKGRADYVNGNTVIDVKTTQNASPTEFSKSLFAFRYYVQAAMYLEAMTQTGHKTTDDFIFIAVEKEPPYLVAVYKLDHEALSLGIGTYTAELCHLANCLKRDEWPGYASGIDTIGLPKWAYL